MNLSGQPAPGLGKKTRAGEARRGRTDVQQARGGAFTTDVSAYPPIPVSGGEYEPAVLSSQPAPGLGTQPRAREARRGRTDVQQARRGAFTTDVSAYPPIPVFNSPEGGRERQQTERLDKDLERTLKSICRGC